MSAKCRRASLNARRGTRNPTADASSASNSAREAPLPCASILADLGPLELRVYDPVTMSAFGPYTAPTLDEDGTWWSTIIFGDTIGLEFYLPPGYTTPPKTLPRIVGAFYCYADFYGSDFEPAVGRLPHWI
jgi:hypothetical protein